MYVIDYQGHEVRVTERSNCLRPRLSYRPGQTYASLSVPAGCSPDMARAYIWEHGEWLREKMSVLQDVTFRPRLAPGERSYLLGRQVTLGQRGIPAGRDFLKLRDQLLYREVARLLPLWEKRMGVHVARLSWSGGVSRWGACKPGSRIVMLSTRLGHLPVECIEMVLVHELCHLMHPDHSAAFYHTMTRFLPDWKTRDLKIRQLVPLYLPPAGA